MKTSVALFSALLIAATLARAQLVNDGATNVLSNVTNTITGTVTVGTNGPFTLLVLSNNTLLTNSGASTIGLNASAKSNEVRLVSPTARWLMGSSLAVGNNGAANRLVVNDGALVSNRFDAYIGLGASASNNVALITGANSCWGAGGSISVGSGSQLIVSNAGRVVSGFEGHVGGVGTQVRVTGAGSQWNMVRDLYAGLGGTASQLRIEDGGQVNNDSGNMGVNALDDGNEVLVTGPGALWTNRLNLWVGLNGAMNRLVISNGGWVVSSNSNVGAPASTGGHSNLALVTGAGSTLSNRANVTVGYRSSGNQLIASNGASLFAGGDAVVGLNSAAPSNSLVITGPGSALRSTFNTIVGRDGAGNRLRIADGGAVSSASGFIGHSSANNEAFLNGPGAIWTNQLDFYVGFSSSGNRLAISNGATLHANDSSYFGYNPGSAGNTATISGPGSVWRSANRLIVGDFGRSNRLTATAGAALNVGGHGVIGVQSGASNNSMIVALPGTTLTVASDFFVGSNGAFNVMTLATGASASVGGDTYIGSGTNGNNNTLAVSDAGTVWTNHGSVYIGGGSVGRNLLAVINGAKVRGFMSAFLGVGGPNNEVIVGDPGSLLDLSSQALYVGLSDAGNRVTVRDGGVIRSSSGQLGPVTFSSNTLVTVTGAGSMWQLTGFMFVGLNGPRHRLVINNGGTVEALLGVGVGQFPSSTNNRVTVDGGVLRGTNVPHNSALAVIRGTNVFNAGLIEFDRLLLTNAQGFFEFNGGTLITRGSSISNGTPFVVGRGGPVPAIWDVRAGGGSHALAGRLTVGSNASFNQVFITNGATLTGGEYTFLALTAGSNNAVTVSGPGSTLNSPSGFFVGADGNANRMLIHNGGQAIAAVGSAGTFIGRSVGTRSNSVTVADPGSRWSINDILYVGSGGHANQMMIGNGAAVDSVQGYVGGATSGSNNLALVTGANSTWSNRTDLYVGAGGSGNRLIVTDGGTVIHSNAFLGLNSSSLNNTVEVSGPGSRWISRTDLILGYDGSASQMSVLNGAVASVGRNLLVGRNPVFSSANRLVVDGGTLAVTNGATSAVLEIHRGTNVLNAGLIEADILRMTNGFSSRFEINGGTLSIKESRVNVGNPVIVGNGVDPATLHLAGSGSHDFTGTLGLILSNNATLTGNGTVKVQLQVRAGAKLSPGAPIGSIVFNGSPIISGTVEMEISKTGTVLANDQLQVLPGTFTYGGSLTVTNLGPTALAAGDNFKLFNATSYAGAFTTISLPPLNAGLVWTNKLLVDGSIGVIVAPPQPGFASIALNGTNVIFSGTNGTPGANYTVLTATNVALPTSNWVSMVTNQFGAGGQFNFTNPIAPGEPERYFRLRTP